MPWTLMTPSHLPTAGRHHKSKTSPASISPAKASIRAELAAEAAVNPNTMQKSSGRAGTQRPGLHSAHQRQIHHRGHRHYAKSETPAGPRPDPAVSGSHGPLRIHQRRKHSASHRRKQGGSVNERTLNLYRAHQAIRLQGCPGQPEPDLTPGPASSAS